MLGGEKLHGVMTKRIALAYSLVLLLLVSCGSHGRKQLPIVVASADSPEQLVLGQITVLALEAAGYSVIDKTGLGRPWMVRAALEAGNVDVCWEYTGDTWASHLGHDQPIAEPGELYERVRQEDAQNGIVWLPVAPCQRRLVLLMREPDAQSKDIASITDLVRHMDRVAPYLSLCVPEQLYGAVGGIRGMERFYGLRFDEGQVHLMSMSEGYQALARGECDCTVGFSTDGEMASGNLRSLDDDRGFFQGSNLSVAVRTPLLQERQGLATTLGQITNLLTQEAMVELNRRAAVEADRPGDVARRFLIRNGVISGWPGTGDE